MTTELTVKEPKEIEAQISELSTRALSIKVADNETLMVADELLSAHKAMEKEIKAFFKPEKEAANKLHKMICDKENAELAKIVPGEQHLKREIADYKLNEQKRREAEEARLRAEAAKREEEERLQRAAEIEAEALRLKASGHVEEAAAVQQEAETVLNTPAYIPAPRVAPTPKTKSTLKMIVDRQKLDSLILAINNGKTPPPQIPGINIYRVWQYLILDESLVPEYYKKPSVGGRS